MTRCNVHLPAVGLPPRARMAKAAAAAARALLTLPSSLLLVHHGMAMAAALWAGKLLTVLVPSIAIIFYGRFPADGRMCAHHQ